jgi:cysteine-rich repeat protein
MENSNISTSFDGGAPQPEPVAPTPEPAAPPARSKRGFLMGGMLAVVLLGGGVAAYFVMGSSNPAAGIPIPNIDGSLAFRVPTSSLTANATYTRDDGQVVHFVDRPSKLERAWMEDNHHILIKFGDLFGFAAGADYDPESVIIGEAFTQFCQSEVTHITDAWYYVYSSPSFEQEKNGVFPTSGFLLGHCKDNLNSFTNTYPDSPTISAGDLVYVAIPPAEALALEVAGHGEGFSGNLHVATGTDGDGDGLIDLMEDTTLGSQSSDFDSDLDGLGDGFEVAGGEYTVAVSGGGPPEIRVIGGDELSWSNPDTDWDGIHDATEMGFTVSQDPVPANSILFVADVNPDTTTDPNDMDSDGGGTCDGPDIYGIACDDDGDNDNDGDKDFPADSGCVSAEDRSELDTENCTGAEDTNANGQMEAGETDASNANDDVPLPPPLGTACGDGVDNDDAEDTLADAADPGCYDNGNVVTGNYDGTDDDETNTPACGNGGLEPDGADGISGNADDETCDDGNTVNGDGCSDTCGVTYACSDNVDNDSDGFTDDTDPGCFDNGNAGTGTHVPADDDESHDVACGNGVLEPNGVDGIAGNADDEECDPGEVTPICDAQCKELPVPEL